MAKKHPPRRRTKAESASSRDAQRREERSPPANEPDGSPRMGAEDADLGRGEHEHRPRLIVGVGASAGGLEALEQLFSRLPARGGLAYVVVQHLAPQHASMLAQLLGRRTEMPVVEAKDGMWARFDHVYVIAPGTILGIRGGAFQVASAEAERHDQIDAFLRSLADDQGERAIGILLSGSGADGTTGLRAIKERGGLTLAQTPETAKYDAMPRSAIEAGVVDHVLLAEEMPAKLIERAEAVAGGRVRAAAPAAAEPSPGRALPSDEQVAASLERIFPILQRRAGHDFSHYKRGTVLRRLRRRLQLRRSPSLDEYLDFLGKDPQEPELLAKELLIGVTQFFRDPEAFEYLARHVLPQIVAAGSADEGLRIWVPGCASGEEAYSIGILVHERLAGLEAAPPVQIFATDIDAEAIAEARQGRYPADIAERVSPERLARFFTREGASFQVVQGLREMCIFSEHSLIRDPPFLNLDLISCRNLLIYLDAELQKKLVPVFHYALERGGFLFLGSSESLAEHPELFETVDKRFRVFRRLESLTRSVAELPLAGGMQPRMRPPPPHAPAAPPPTQAQVVNVAFERLMLQEYAPPGAVVNERGDVVCVAGLTGGYLQPPAGVLTTNVFDIAHASLRVELRTALHAAARSGRRQVKDGVQVEVNGSTRRLRVTVRPLPAAQQEGLFAVILQEQAEGTGAEAAEPATAVGGGSAPAIEQLESELRSTRASLRATIEELESSNEELKSSNEELLSTNEEMQSTNEELQSSQEELRSVNEEMATVNSELGRKVDELAQANNDLLNLFASTDVATLFLDRQLRVARFTPAAQALFRLIDADVGRPISDLAPRLMGQDLAADADEVLRTLRPVERQVETIDRRAWYLLRVLPYHTVENVIAGAVITLADITRLKQAEADLQRLATVVLDSNDAVTVHDLEGRILAWNRGAERMYGYSAEEARRVNMMALVPEEGRAQARGLLEAIERGEEVASLEVERLTKDGATLDVWLTVTRLVDDHGRPVAVATTERDVTQRKRAEQELRSANERLLETDRRKDEFLAMLSHELRNPLAPIRSSLDILGHAAPGGEQAQRAQAIIDRQVGHMTRLIDDLLDVTRITRGKVELHRERLDLCGLTRRAVEDQRGAFAEGGIELQVSTDPPEIWVNGDPTRLAQVIGNLLQNAAKFTPLGGRTTVTVRPEPPASGPWSACRTTAAVSRPRSCHACFSPSPRRTPPSTARRVASVSAWRWSRAWSRCTVARWAWRATDPARAQPSRSPCQSRRRSRPMRCSVAVRPEPRCAGCWSSRTTSTRPRASARCSSSAGTRWRSPTAGPRGWRRPDPSGPRWCSATSGCPGSTATRWRGPCAPTPGSLARRSSR
jgi:two-component system CheB/CheR fusion protein